MAGPPPSGPSTREPTTERLSRTERATLNALCDTFVPRDPARAPSSIQLPSASDVGVDVEFARVVDEYLSTSERQEFRQMLATVERPGMNLLLSGRWERFSRLDERGRERYLLAWGRSALSAKRRGFHAVKQIALFLYYARAFPPHQGNPAWAAVGYSPVDPSGGRGFAAPRRSHSPRGLSGVSELSADVCVIGSGAGGSVIAAHLARSGYRVLVLEAGPFRTASSFSLREGDSYDRMFAGHGLLTTKDNAFAILAGRTAGGSTTVNWMTCLPPPPEVRVEWHDAHGLSDVVGPSFDALLSSVSDRLHVGVGESAVNPANDVLRRGCRALGYSEGTDYRTVPRNALGCDGRCGPCVFGCPHEAKQSALVTFLSDAAASGAELVCDAHVEELVVEGDTVRSARFTYRADGFPARSITVRARHFVLAGNALETPALLLRSGFRGPSIGRHLHLHPTTALFGEFGDPIRMWDGPMQTIVVERLRGIDPPLHGPWLESAPAHPGLSGLGLPWHGAAEHRRLMGRLDHAAATIVLVRDVGEGRVSIDGDGRPVVSYRLHRRDRHNLVEGLVEAARIQHAAGATRLGTLHLSHCAVGDGTGPVSAAKREALEERIRSLGIRENWVRLFSAHPTGSVRLGTAPATSGADVRGRVWGTTNLWVGDGSALPSAPGVNPMITIMAMASRTAGGLSKALASSPA